MKRGLPLSRLGRFYGNGSVRKFLHSLASARIVLEHSIFVLITICSRSLFFFLSFFLFGLVAYHGRQGGREVWVLSLLGYYPGVSQTTSRRPYLLTTYLAS